LNITNNYIPNNIFIHLFRNAWFGIIFSDLFTVLVNESKKSKNLAK